MKLTKKSTYALKTVILLVELAGETPVSCRTLAEQGHMPYRYLLSILRTLVTRGYLVSRRGAAGGFELSREPSRVSLLDIIEAVEGRLAYDDSRCLEFAGRVRPQMLEAFDGITQLVRQQLQSIKLSDVVPTELENIHLSDEVTNVARVDATPHNQNVAWTSPQLSASSSALD